MSDWRRDGPDRNAVLYGADGQVVSEHVLGDGIEHVLATSTGQVWVGYFDEGIYGNYGWGGADSEEPAGAYGIVRFSPRLEPEWHYPRYTEVGPWEPLPPGTQVTGRGSRLHFLTDTSWYQLEMDDIPVTG